MPFCFCQAGLSIQQTLLDPANLDVRWNQRLYVGTKCVPFKAHYRVNGFDPGIRERVKCVRNQRTPE